ncbi:MAG: beta-N-acetylhexosaminidase [Planctomycetes bacterium]|nr:beta-N-acetylhexosaminidase [Planctomycetota bacterium]
MMTVHFLPLIPAPERVEPQPGTFAPPPDRGVVWAGPPAPAGMDRAVAGALGAALRPAAAARPGDLWFRLAPADAGTAAEGYALTTGPDGAVATAASAAGLWNAAQTLRQLLPSSPAVAIRDAPRFGWRGLLLDCCRHFLDVGFVERTVDLLAQHKLNRLHWHLTEDQGWRLELRRHPELVEIGAWRDDGHGGRYGGYYTQDDVRRVIAYAAARGVEVVPEIELPGHCVAALAARPELSCTGGPHAVETRWGIFEDVYCAGNDATFTFLEDVLDEVLELFPSHWVHIGGDEVPKDRWRDCPKCQQRMRDEGLRDEDELQSWFVRRIVAFLHARGRRAIGWDEILEGGLAPGAIVQSWRGLDGAVAAVRAGHEAIVSPTSHAYLDYPSDKIDLRTAYGFEPVPAGLTDAERRLVIGGECNMWTERAPQDVVWQRIFPRALAIAERLWSRGADDYEGFRARVVAHRPRLRAQGVEFGEEP